MDFVDLLETRILQVMALFLVPIILIVGLNVLPAVIQSINDVVIGFNAQATVLMLFILPVIGAVGVFLLMWGIYAFVRNGGPGVLK